MIPNKIELEYTKLDKLLPQYIRKIVNIKAAVISIEAKGDNLMIVQIKANGKIMPINFWRDETEFHPHLTHLNINMCYAFQGFFVKANELSASYFIKIVQITKKSN